jgi:mono/diheme cytochrome c family protein
MNVHRPIGAAILALALAAVAAAPAWAQANLDAGKSPAKIFAQGCGSCHGTPHELHDIRRDFLLQHYTTGSQQADMIADYLEAVRSEPPPKPRRGPRAEIEVADALVTGSIGVTAPESAPAEARKPEIAPPDTIQAEAASPVPLDIDE